MFILLFLFFILSVLTTRNIRSPQNSTKLKMENEIINLDTHRNLEKTIIKVITKIRNGRWRLGYQNIQTHLNRGE